MLLTGTLDHTEKQLSALLLRQVGKHGTDEVGGALFGPEVLVKRLLLRPGGLDATQSKIAE